MPVELFERALISIPIRIFSPDVKNSYAQVEN